MVHILHDEQLRLVREFLGYFIRPEMLTEGSRRISSPEIDNEKIWLPVTDMFLGPFSRKIFQRSNSKDPIIRDISERIQKAFVSCGKVLQKKMPITNELLKTLSAIDSYAWGHSVTVRCLPKLQGSYQMCCQKRKKQNVTRKCISLTVIQQSLNSSLT